MPFFSIIIPVYNVAPYLRECLDSVLAQTFTDWEAICVDDGSTDGSGTILDEYTARDPRFRVIRQPNAGVSAARNKGLKKALGEWIWFIDADDAIHPNSLCFLNNLTCVDRGVKTISFTTNRESEQSPGVWGELPNVAQCIKKDYIDSQSLRMHRRGAWATIIRTEIAKKFCFQNFTIGEDVLYHMNILWSYPVTCLISAPIYFYRTRSGSAVNSKVSREKVCDFLTTEYKMLELYENNCNKRKIKDIKDYYRWNEDFIWYTFAGMFFRLPLAERSSCLDKWVCLQKLQHKVLLPKPYKKFVLQVLKIIPSVSLCTLLVCGQRLIQRKYNGIKCILAKQEW